MWADTEHQQGHVRSSEMRENSDTLNNLMDGKDLEPPGTELQPHRHPSSWINDQLNQAGAVFSWALKKNTNEYNEQDWQSLRLFLRIELLFVTLLIISALGDTFELRRLVNLRSPTITERSIEATPQSKVVFDSVG